MIADCAKRDTGMRERTSRARRVDEMGQAIQSEFLAE
jgi:hypothetical protein